MANNKKGINEVIGDRIRSALGQKYTNKQLADYLNIKPNMISYYIKGTRVPDAGKMVKIAEFLDVSLDYLYGQSDVPTSDKDVQFVSEYTGLTITSINKLKAGSPKVQEETINAMNILLNNKFSDILLEISKAYKDCDRMIELRDILNKQYNVIFENGDQIYNDDLISLIADENSEFNKLQQEYEELIEKHEYSLFRLQKDFINCVEKYTSSGKERTHNGKHQGK